METTLTSGQLGLQLKIFDEKKMTPDRWNRILSSGIFADLCDPNAYLSDRNAVRKALKLGAVMPEQIVLSVDYGRSLEQTITAGNYDWKSVEITAERFPVVGSGIVQYEAKLFHFNRNTSSQDNVDAIKADDPANPWEPGKIEHLLSFGEKYPEEQRKYPIIALGSVAEICGDRYAQDLYRRGARRCLYLSWWDIVWHGRCRFLAVRPVKISGSLAPQA